MNNMTPEDKATKEIMDIVEEVYSDVLYWLPSWISKRVSAPVKLRTYSIKITNVLRHYVEAKNNEHEK